MLSRYFQYFPRNRIHLNIFWALNLSARKLVLADQCNHLPYWKKAEFSVRKKKKKTRVTACCNIQILCLGGKRRNLKLIYFFEERERFIEQASTYVMFPKFSLKTEKISLSTWIVLFFFDPRWEYSEKREKAMFFILSKAFPAFAINHSFN